MAENKYVLAMYDVRGKQDYIFRGKKLKEIVGGSLVIRDIFKDELYPAAKEFKYGKPKNEDEKETIKNKSEVIYSYKLIQEKGEAVEDTGFTREKFENHITNDGYIGEVVYDGGGNFFILYKDKKTFVGVNKIFTQRVLEHTYSLTVLCSCIEGVDFGNYTTLPAKNGKREAIVLKGDREKLYEENRRREARINPQLPAQVLPFTQVDYANSLPLYKYSYEINSKLTREAARKYEKYKEVVEKNKQEYGEKVLDQIVREKGKDSWISVMYIDGNNMGAKVQSVFDKYKEEEKPHQVSYEIAVEALRKFSNEIQKDYIDDRIKAIDKKLKEKYKQDKEDYKRRLVVYAGDEINIILNAHDALDATKAYFDGMKKGSACAGIAIFKSHTPYSDAYRIAEEACETGKTYMKKYHMRETNFIDFHYCQGAIGSDLESIREREIGDLISKPWLVNYNETEAGKEVKKEELVTLDMIEDVSKGLNTCTRTNIKGLLECAKKSEADLFTELKRMEVRRKSDKVQIKPNITEVKNVEGKQVSKELFRKMIYDIVSVYDLWFRPEEAVKEDKE